MTKKIVAAVISALLLVGACVFGFVYSGIPVTVPTAGSNVKIAEPQQLNEYLENLPDLTNYYSGKVKGGKYNDKDFHTLTVNEYQWCNQSSEDESFFWYKSRWIYSFGSDAMSIRWNFYGDWGDGKQDDDKEIEEQNILFETEIYIAEKTFCLCIRKFECKDSFIPGTGTDGSEEVKVLKKCIQNHLGEWVSLNYDIFSPNYYSTMDEDHATCELLALSIGVLLLGFGGSYGYDVLKLINDYVADPESWSKSGNVFMKEENVDEDEHSYKSENVLGTIDLRGGTPQFAKYTDYSLKIRTGESETGYDDYFKDQGYHFSGIGTTKVTGPKKTVDAYSVFYEYVKAEKEKMNND